MRYSETFGVRATFQREIRAHAGTYEGDTARFVVDQRNGLFGQWCRTREEREKPALTLHRAVDLTDREALEDLLRGATLKRAMRISASEVAGVFGERRETMPAAMAAAGIAPLLVRWYAETMGTEATGAYTEVVVCSRAPLRFSERLQVGVHHNRTEQKRSGTVHEFLYVVGEGGRLGVYGTARVLELPAAVPAVPAPGEP